MATTSRISWFFVLFSLCIVCHGQTTNYIIGAGIADITGPAAEVDMVCGVFFTIFLMSCNLMNIRSSVKQVMVAKSCTVSCLVITSGGCSDVTPLIC